MALLSAATASISSPWLCLKGEQAGKGKGEGVKENQHAFCMSLIQTTPVHNLFSHGSPLAHVQAPFGPGQAAGHALSTVHRPADAKHVPARVVGRVQLERALNLGARPPVVRLPVVDLGFLHVALQAALGRALRTEQNDVSRAAWVHASQGRPMRLACGLWVESRWADGAQLASGKGCRDAKII